MEVFYGNKCIWVDAKDECFEICKLQTLYDDVENFCRCTRKSTPSIHNRQANTKIMHDAFSKFVVF